MEELYNLNISENTLKSMIELNPDIKNITNEEVREKVIILESLDCTDMMIRNIISCNPLFLTTNKEDINILLNKLFTIGFETINILLDSNPFILNIEIEDLDNYIKERMKNGELFEEIVNDLESNPYLFNEI